MVNQVGLDSNGWFCTHVVLITFVCLLFLSPYLSALSSFFIFDRAEGPGQGLAWRAKLSMLFPSCPVSWTQYLLFPGHNKD